MALEWIAAGRDLVYMTPDFGSGGSIVKVKIDILSLRCLFQSEMLGMVPAVYQDSSVTKHWDNHKSSINLTKYLSWIQFRVVEPVFNITSHAV